MNRQQRRKRRKLRSLLQQSDSVLLLPLLNVRRILLNYIITFVTWREILAHSEISILLQYVVVRKTKVLRNFFQGYGQFLHKRSHSQLLDLQKSMKHPLHCRNDLKDGTRILENGQQIFVQLLQIYFKWDQLGQAIFVLYINQTTCRKVKFMLRVFIKHAFEMQLGKSYM